jgi:hypothetical protein
MATSRALKELVVRTLHQQRVWVRVPDCVRVNLEFLEVADEVLIPSKRSLSPPESFLRARVAKAFE